MSQKYLKPKKKFISKTLMMKELNLGSKDFDKLVSLTGVYPYVPKEKQKVDRIQDFFYKIEDFDKIKKSHVYKTIKINRKKENKRNKYVENRLLLRAEKIYDSEFRYVDLVKERYPTLPKALDELGNSLTSLCLGMRLGMDDEIEDIYKELKKFVIDKLGLKYSFMSTKGIYYEVRIENLRIIWLSSYEGTCLKDIIEVKKDEPKPFKWSSLNFLHFASDSEDDLEDEEFKPINDPDKLDVSLLSYSIPFQKYHIRLVLLKLNKLYKETGSRSDSSVSLSRKSSIFSGIRFYIECQKLYDDLCFIILSESGIISDENNFDICLGEKIDNYVKDKVYLHPQYIFDSKNSNKKLEYDSYLIGKKIPKHKSPFVIDNFINPDILLTLSKNKRNKLLDIVDGYEDVHYRNK